MAAIQARQRIRPMRVGESLTLLTVVILLGLASFYGLRPRLEQAGWASYPAYLVSLSCVFVVMLVWTPAAYLAEGQSRSWKAFLERMRLTPIRRSVLGWGLGLGCVMFLMTAVFSPLLSRAIADGLLPLPAGIPDYLDPSRQQSLGLLKQQFVNQGILPWMPLVLTLNILAEELFWRGMIFPRQELRHGKRTWILHGLIWCVSHAFQYWLLPPILLGSLALAWTVQRTRSTWVGVIAHLVNNGLPFLLMLLLPV